jgi:DNA-binding MarR family transcriptional regulator
MSPGVSGVSDALDADARRLLAALAAEPDAPFPGRVLPGETALRLGYGPAMAWKLLRRLFAAGYYEYDISAYNGRLTEAGRQAAKRINVL